MITDSGVRKMSVIKQRLRACLATMNGASQNEQEVKFQEYIGIRLRQRRIELGYTQTRIANALNCTFQQIQKYEKATNGMSLVKFVKFLEYTNTDWSYFYRPLNKLGKRIYLNGGSND